jgi:mono/diheme cytochrome c family protein
MNRFSNAALMLGLAAAWLLAFPSVRRADAQASGEDPIGAGSTLYRTYCASCHGVSGRGDGPVAEHLRRPPGDLTRLALGNNGVFPEDRLVRIIDGRQMVRTHGDSDMPVWGDGLSRSIDGGDEALRQARIREIVKHLASLQQRRSD